MQFQNTLMNAMFLNIYPNSTLFSVSLCPIVIYLYIVALQLFQQTPDIKLHIVSTKRSEETRFKQFQLFLFKPEAEGHKM